MTGHELRSTPGRPDGVVVGYVCTCGTQGRATRAFAGEDLVAKAKLNHKQHVKREARRA